MTQQIDLFGHDEAATRSFPPHLDPAKVHDFAVECHVDRDHVAAPVDGRLPVGALGNNRHAWLALVLDQSRAVLASFPFDTEAAALAKVRELRDTVDLNRQMVLL